MAHHDRLARERVGTERGKEQGGLRHVFERRELSVDGFLEHDVSDHVLLGNAELPWREDLTKTDGCLGPPGEPEARLVGCKLATKPGGYRHA